MSEFAASLRHESLPWKISAGAAHLKREVYSSNVFSCPQKRLMYSLKNKNTWIAIFMTLFISAEVQYFYTAHSFYSPDFQCYNLKEEKLVHLPSNKICSFSYTHSPYEFNFFPFRGQYHLRLMEKEIVLKKTEFLLQVNCVQYDFKLLFLPFLFYFFRKMLFLGQQSPFH